LVHPSSGQGVTAKVMAAQDFLLDSQVREWLDGVEPAWTLLTFESLQALRHEPAATRTAIRIANDLSCDEIARSPIARNTLILLRAAIAHGGLPLTATGNLTRAVVAKMCTLVAWPDYDQADAFRFNKVINEPDFLPLHVVRQLVQAASLVRAQRGRLAATPLGESLLSEARQGSLLAILFILRSGIWTWVTSAADCSGPGPRKMRGLCFGHCRPAPMNGNPPRN
jgi:LPS sulfotransferase NodH